MPSDRTFSEEITRKFGLFLMPVKSTDAEFEQREVIYVKRTGVYPFTRS